MTEGSEYTQFFETDYADVIDEVTDEHKGSSNDEMYPVPIDYEDLRAFSEERADRMLQSPDSERTHVENVLADQFHLTRAVPRVHNLPEDRTFRVGMLRRRHLNRLIAVRGEVVGIDPVEPLLIEGAFECRCGTTTSMPQNTYGDIIEPHDCLECGEQGPFDLIEKRSDLADFQAVVIIPLDTNLDDPPAAPVYLKHDLCGRLRKGAQVTVTGVYNTMSFDRQKETRLNTFIEAVDIDADASQVDQLSQSELWERVEAFVREHQAVDSDYLKGQFGVGRDTVVKELSQDEAVNDTDLTDCIDTHIERSALLETNGRLSLP